MGMLEQLKNKLMKEEKANKDGNVVGTINYNRGYTRDGHTESWLFGATDQGYTLEIDFTHLALVYGIDRIFIVDGDIGPHGDGTIIDMIGDDPNQATTFYTTGPNVTIMLTSAPSSWAEGRTVFNTVVTEVPPTK